MKTPNLPLFLPAVTGARRLVAS